MPAESSTPLEGLVRQEEAAATLAALDHLAPLERESLLLRYFQHFEIAEVAETLGKSTHQIRSLCHKGVKRLRARLGTPDVRPRIGGKP